MTATTTTIKNKPLKWTTQRVVNNIKPTTTTANNNRVQKRTTTTNATMTRNNIAAAIMTAEIKTNPREEIERLSSELEFTYDTVATITVHFESLHHAYTCSKPELDKSKSATRLGEMEKELLTAYDDLGLQVTHLERKISKLEKRLAQLRELESIYVASPVKEQKEEVSVPAPVATIEQTPQQQKQQEFSPYTYDLISSPCSSTDSSIAEYQFENNFYCDDWTLSQIINNEDQQALLFDNSSFSVCNNNYTTASIASSTTEYQQQQDYYQELYCDLSSTTVMNMYYINNSNNTNDLYLS